MSDEIRAADRPATFRDVFSSREYRFLFSATFLSWFGDYMAKAAVTALVLFQTESIPLSAATFALSYLPWLFGGPFLAAIAERRKFRSTMVACDVFRAVLIMIVAIPGMPVAAMLALLFAAAMATPPWQAARSAVLPQILTEDRYVVGLSIQQSVGQGAQLGGYLAGAVIAPFAPRVALVIDAATFLISALLIRRGMADRSPIGDPGPRSHLAAETLDGFRVIFGTRVLRAIALIVFCMMPFAIVPEGLAAGWASQLSESRADRGWIQGMIMVAEPLGFILGGLVIGRLIRPNVRRKLVRPFVVLAPLALVPALTDPPVVVLTLMATVCGFAIAGMLPAANGMFVQALPAGYRARAFGVMQAGIQIIQGGSVLLAGALAAQFKISTVVGTWSLAGAFVMLFVMTRWPTDTEFERAVATARRANGETTGSPPTPPGAGRRPGPVEATA